MHRKMFAGAIVSLALLAPVAASAVTIEELQAQIRELLAKVAALQTEIRSVTETEPVTVSDIQVTAVPRICKVLPPRAFSIGEEGEEVRSLQEFLRAEGVLDANATGYFGPLTERALGAWQLRQKLVTAANPALGWGVLGPRTRAAIASWCEGPRDERAMRAAPQSGSAPLAVTFTTNVQLSNPNFIADAGDYKIDFGDGSEHRFECVDGASCPGPHTVTHTYAQDGVYRASLIHYGYFGLPASDGGAPQQIVNSIEIRVGTEQDDVLTVSPTSGSAPLTVTITSKIGDQRGIRPSAYDAQDTLIDFGDGSERVWVSCDTIDSNQFGGQRSGGQCATPVSFSHTYARDGVYTVSLVRAGGMCVGQCPERVRASATVRVGEAQILCTKEFRPVCAEKQVQCVTAPCNPVQETYGNSCMARAAGATIVHEGACRSASADPSQDPRCKAWFDGCNSCGRAAPGELAACTLKYCAPEHMQKPYCTQYFEGENAAPVISSFSGPTRLGVHEVGTWSVSASDPENGGLKYSIVWGDEWYKDSSAYNLARPSASIVQRSTFTHSYANPGTYTVQMSVFDEAGNVARASATVAVEETLCTMEYAPVCGRPKGCANSCAPGASVCAAVCRLHEPVTYGNRCQMHNANATLLYEGTCTGNETF